MQERLGLRGYTDAISCKPPHPTEARKPHLNPLSLPFCGKSHQPLLTKARQTGKHHHPFKNGVLRSELGLRQFFDVVTTRQRIISRFCDTLINKKCLPFIVIMEFWLLRQSKALLFVTGDDFLAQKPCQIVATVVACAQLCFRWLRCPPLAETIIALFGGFIVLVWNPVSGIAPPPFFQDPVPTTRPLSSLPPI